MTEGRSLCMSAYDPHTTPSGALIQLAQVAICTQVILTTLIKMSSSKSRRKVTVESTTKSSSESSAEKRKPSVFARLGPGAPRRSYEESEPLEKCRNWMKTGECVYGSKCRYQHTSRRDSRERSPSSHRRSRKRKGGDRDLEPSAEEDLCEIEDADKERRERKNRSKKEKESKVKSAIVVTKANLANSENADSDQPQEPEKEELDDFDATLKLMEKRQLIQKQLSMLEAEEVNKDPIEGSTITKSVSPSLPCRQVASDVLDREPVTVPTGSWSGRWDQPKKTSATLSNEDSPSK
ncbi:hypothetical protein LSAT2_010076 [Lamellibrachia satsuma]|nr:hypothetical protein LSAT2_010076 [Lamellibrachia satsuma]